MRPRGGKSRSAPASARRDPARAAGLSSRVELVLSIAKTGLGLELGKPASLGPCLITELSCSLPDLRFPVDVTGGVARFRHRRGALESLSIEAPFAPLEAWMAPPLRGLLTPATPDVALSRRGPGVTVTVADLDGAGSPVLAFDVDLVAAPGGVAILVHRARGADLPMPASALAIRAVDALTAGFARRSGGMFTAESVPSLVVRDVFPEAGARAPDAGAMITHALSFAGGSALVVFRRGRSTEAPAEAEATLARETLLLCTEIDDALFLGRLEEARARALAALERAPRHPEIARRIVELDAHHGGRPDAAWSLARSLQGELGALGAALARASGDAAGALSRLVADAERETSNLLSARLFVDAALATRSDDEAFAWLAEAIARAPRWGGARWARAERLLRAGRVEAARADAEHAEAIASGAPAKLSALSRAGAMWDRAGLPADAARFYERALVFAPEDPGATGGLGRSLIGAGRVARGVALLSTALDRAPDRTDLLVPLARALAERLRDLPTAIARLSSARGAEARALEARYRKELGDLPGASLAYARMRDDLLREAAGTAELADAVAWLLEAAAFEHDARQDPSSAQRHALAAKSLDASSLAVDAWLGKLRDELVGPPSGVISRAEEPFPATQIPRGEDALEQAASRAEILTRVVQGDPTNDAVVLELAKLFLVLDRPLEAFALLSGRLEEAPDASRAILVPVQRRVLTVLEEAARQEGRRDEADLFRDAREGLET